MRRIAIAGLVVLLVGACSDDAGAYGDFMDDDLPSGACPGSGTGPCLEGSPVGTPCAATSECVEAAVCAAPFSDGEAGEPVCTAQCIPLDNEVGWCIDAAACCDAGATCTPRGVCVMQAAASDDTAGPTSGGTIDGDSSASDDTATAGDDTTAATTDPSTTDPSTTDPSTTDTGASTG